MVKGCAEQFIVNYDFHRTQAVRSILAQVKGSRECESDSEVRAEFLNRVPAYSQSLSTDMPR